MPNRFSVSTPTIHADRARLQPGKGESDHHFYIVPETSEFYPHSCVTIFLPAHMSEAMKAACAAFNDVMDRAEREAALQIEEAA